MIASTCHVLLLLTAPPLFLGIVNRTKAIVAGRQGPPLLQVWYDLWKLARKGAVYSRVTTQVFRLGPLIGLAAVLVAGFCVPLAGIAAPLGFTGDVVLFVALLALARFVTVAMALDTGSAFSGMGAAREATFASLAEPVFYCCLVVLAAGRGELSLTEVLGPGLWQLWGRLGPALVLVAVAFAVLLLVENCRVPFDDPNTHLELTMIHEVMVLDHGGPDLGAILYGAAIKLFLFAAILVRLVLPTASHPLVDALVFGAGMVGVGIGIGVVESSMARLRLPRVPTALGGALAVAAIALAVLFSIGGRP